MNLTKGQGQALNMAKRIAASRMQRPAIGVLKGFAGVGKTTMLKVIADEIGDCVIITPTGKAALRVSEATGLGARTIHRWMYQPQTDPFTGGVHFIKAALEKIIVPPSRLVIIDEASMVGLEVWEDIFETCSRIGCNILAVGDPFQLPPVQDRASREFSLLAPEFAYDEQVTLTEVLRQALESPIVRSSMELRRGDVFKAISQIPFEWRVFDKDLFDAMEKVLNDKGVIIAHRNQTRHTVNRIIRKHRGLGTELVKGEPLLVTKNNYDCDPELYNGEVVEFQGWDFLDDKNYEIYDHWKKESGVSQFGRGLVDGRDVIIPIAGVFGNLENIGMNAVEKVGKHACGKHLGVLQSNFGYCLTAHKSQGSEWGQVLVMVESSVRADTTDGKRWLYTALTRAKDKVLLSWNPKLEG